jgi:hypothetical protein
LRQERAADGPGEGTHDAKENKYRVDRIDGTDCPQSEEPKKTRAGGITGVAEKNKFAPVVAIGSMAGNEKEKYPGKKLGQANETEVQGALGEFIDLPADRDRLHLCGENDTETC